MKQDSEIGVALAAGHPCYFVGFLPEPMPGQTIEDVCTAEARFVEEVARAHPEAEGKPVHHRQLPGRLADHDDGRDPARSCPARSCWPARRCPTGPACAARTRCAISAALLGGTWLTALAGDLGDGIFDGANLVANFESLQPGQHLLGEALQRLFQGRHRSGALPRLRDLVGQPGAAQCRRDAVDRRQPVRRQQARPRARSRTSDGVRVDLRNIQLADHRVLLVGRQHHAAAAGAGLDHRPLRPRATRSSRTARPSSTTLHQTIGHLGIFVSGKVATKEHGEFATCMDMIDLMPPGLYEAVITEVDDDTGQSRADRRQVSVPAGGAHAGRHPGARRQQRGGRAALRRRRPASPRSITGLYRTFAQPAVRAMAQPSQSADADARTAPQPAALRRFSDRNPLMQPVKALAERCAPTASRSPPTTRFCAMEQVDVDLDHDLLESYRHRARRHDRGDVPRHLRLAAAAGDGRAGDARGADAAPHRARPRARGDRGTAAGRSGEAVRGGRPAEAVVRAIMLCPAAGAARSTSAASPSCRPIRRAASRPSAAAASASSRTMFREQYLLLRLDEERAVRAMPQLLPDDERARERGAGRPCTACSTRSGALPDEGRRRLERIETLFGAPGRAEPAKERRTCLTSPTGRDAAHEKYERLIAAASKHPPLATAVAHPCDEVSLEGAVEAARTGPDRSRSWSGRRRASATWPPRRSLDIGAFELVDCRAQPRLGRQGRRARARRAGRSPDEGQPAYRRADGRRRGARDRHPHGPPHQPLLRHGRAGPSQTP